MRFRYESQQQFMWNSYNQENGNTEKCTLIEHGLVKDYSTGGRLWGHPMLGVMMVEEMVNEHFKETNPQKVKLLEHIIASHHGTLDLARLSIAECKPL